MDAETLASEVLRIAGLPAIEHEPAVDALWKRCKSEGYTQQKPMLRSLVKAQLDAPRDAQAQTGLQQMLADYFAITIRGKFRIGFFTSEQVNGHGRRILNLMTRADFTAWAENKPEGELWLKNPQRRGISRPDYEPRQASRVGKEN